VVQARVRFLNLPLLTEEWFGASPTTLLGVLSTMEVLFNAN